MLINYMLFSLLKGYYSSYGIKANYFGNPIFENKYENEKLKENVIALLPEADCKK